VPTDSNFIIIFSQVNYSQNHPQLSSRTASCIHCCPHSRITPSPQHPFLTGGVPMYQSESSLQELCYHPTLQLSFSNNRSSYNHLPATTHFELLMQIIGLKIQSAREQFKMCPLCFNHCQDLSCTIMKISSPSTTPCLKTIEFLWSQIHLTMVAILLSTKDFVSYSSVASRSFQSVLIARCVVQT